jgi:tetratricopeptide (TPR) repeat protein
MNKAQLVTILFSIALVFGMYYGCDRIPPQQKALEQSRSLVVEATDPLVLINAAREELAPAQRGALAELETELENALADSSKVAVLKQLSGRYYEWGFPAISGYYAEQIADLESTEEAWSIAGTTYTIALQRSEDEQTRSFATGRAIRAYENAISLNPDNPANQVNLALVYTENPPEENPMQGIQLLLELNKEYPDNVYILNNLGRLAIRTGQFDRAIERLERARSQAPEQTNTICLLAQAYRGAGDTEQAEQWDEKCQSLRQNAGSE